MNELQVFTNRKFGEVRMIADNGAMLFCGADVAKALKYARPSEAISKHCNGTLKRRIGVKTGKKADGSPIMQDVEMLFISEPDLYRLIVRSNMPEAQEFERWVFEEVLPTVRKTGGYVANGDMFVETYLPHADAATKDLFRVTLEVINGQNKQIAEQKQQIAAKDEKIAEQAPKAAYYDEFYDANGLSNIRDAAKQIGLKERVLIQLLLDDHLLYRTGGQSGQLRPTAERNHGYFKLKDDYRDPSGRIGKQTYVTPRGKSYLKALYRMVIEDFAGADEA